MSNITTIQFAAFARKLGALAKARGMEAPSFRAPPRTINENRTIRRNTHGVVVSVRLKGRLALDVYADMIAGVVSANRTANATQIENFTEAAYSAVNELVLQPERKSS